MRRGMGPARSTSDLHCHFIHPYRHQSSADIWDRTPYDTGTGNGQGCPNSYFPGLVSLHTPGLRHRRCKNVLLAHLSGMRNSANASTDISITPRTLLYLLQVASP